MGRPVSGVQIPPSPPNGGWMRYLTSASIENFKGFLDAQLFNFAYPNNHLLGLTVIVGPNNSGKSTLFDAILKVKSRSFPKDERRDNAVPKIQLFGNDDTVQIITTIDGGRQASMSNENFSVYTFDFIPSRRNWDSEHNSTNNDLSSVSTTYLQEYRKDTIDRQFSTFLDGLSMSSDKKARFNEKMKIIYPDFSNWTIEQDNNHSSPYVQYLTQDGATHNISLSGDGILSLFKIIAYLEFLNDDRIFMIDEPELSLHPQIQKKLTKYIYDKSKERQIILATHSPYFIDWSILTQGSVIRLNKEKGCICKTYSINKDQQYLKAIESLSKEYQKPQLLDVVAKEIFFSEKILFVEGQEDVGIIRNYVHNETYDIFGYGSGGARNMHLFIRLAHDLGIKIAGLVDKPERVNVLTELCENYGIADVEIFELETEDIRDKKDDQGTITRTGTFDSKGTIKPEYKEGFDKIINKINEYFEES
jgi:predicted ATP-dependent endonuclease of OLD family